MRESMKDFIGKEVRVGDYIFYSTTGRYAESHVCRVTRFTAKTMFAMVLKRNRNFGYRNEEVKVQNSFVKLVGHEE